MTTQRNIQHRATVPAGGVEFTWTSNEGAEQHQIVTVAGTLRQFSARRRVGDDDLRKPLRAIRHLW